MEDPRNIWLSDNFRLSDFLGNHSVYARGIPNHFYWEDGEDEGRLDNATALCTAALEPILEEYGPMSISYGYISPEFSRATVKYQDPDKPSHHRWDLGAAADIVVHRWVQGHSFKKKVPLANLFMDENTRTSPIALAHAIDSELQVPYSRMITYSESPCVCVAVKHSEVEDGRPRKAFYENRYMGAQKAKPLYIQMPSTMQKSRGLESLQTERLPFPWEGSGSPTYHGGGVRQYQHTRVSRYTTVLDWLFNLQSISTGVRNTPALNSPEVQDGFAAAGILFDHIQDHIGVPRISILGGYVCRTHPEYKVGSDWRDGTVRFLLGSPRYMDSETFMALLGTAIPEYAEMEVGPLGVHISAPSLLVLEDDTLVE